MSIENTYLKLIGLLRISFPLARLSYEAINTPRLLDYREAGALVDLGSNW